MKQRQREPKGNRRRALLRVRLVTVLVMVLGLGGLGGYLVGTATGLRWAWAGLARVVPGELSAVSLEGRLIGPLTVHGVRYRDESVDLVLGQLRVDWRPLALLGGTLHVTAVTGREISVTVRQERQEQASSAELPQFMLPVGLKLDVARVSRVSVSAPGLERPLRIEELTVRAGMTDGRLRVRSLDVAGEGFRLAGTGELTLLGDYPLEATLDWAVRLAGPQALEGATRLSGTLQALEIAQSVTGAFTARLEGRVDELLSRPHWDATIHIERAEARRIQSAWPPVSLAGELRSRGEAGAFELSGAVQAVHPLSGALHARLGVKAEGERWRIEALDVSQPATGPPSGWLASGGLA